MEEKQKKINEIKTDSEAKAEVMDKKDVNDKEEIKIDDDKFIEEMDETQIKAELAGRVVEDYAYQFMKGGIKVTGLSYAGVMAAARKQGNIKVVSIEFDEDENKVIAKCRAIDTKNNIEVIGVATQSKKYSSGYPDEFAFQKAASKAQRNAIRKLINEPVAKAILEMALEKKEQMKKDAKSFM